MRRTLLLAFSLSLMATAAPAQLIRTIEAENVSVTCGAKKLMAENGFASGGKLTPEFWGNAPGDAIEWTEELKKPAAGLKLGIRYAYHHKALVAAKGPNLPQELSLIVNGRRLPVILGDTGFWDRFDTVAVELPELPAGPVTFRLEAGRPLSNRNVDCFYFFRGGLDALAPQRRTNQVAQAEDGRLFVWMAPEVELACAPEYVLDAAKRLQGFLSEQSGWSPPQRNRSAFSFRTIARRAWRISRTSAASGSATRPPRSTRRTWRIR